MAENIENNGCSQRDNAEHEGYVKASRSFNRIWKERDSAQPRLLEAILYKDNFNRAYKRVKANKGAPGIDGMTIEEALPYLKEHQQEITDRIYRGKYTPSPVRRATIPKPDGGVRKLGIPTVVDRTLQQAITQQLVQSMNRCLQMVAMAIVRTEVQKMQYLRLRSMQNKAIHSL